MTAAEIPGGEAKYEARDIFREFKDVFLFPLISGVMFGLGTIAGKKLGEVVLYQKSIAK
eukprot:CAMPEP_0198726452 /NCGR_PEP_ID=MMETSP1475-20131203/3498_1 /TAXON_ID= ORGANISM="Unidentified sp., Strain CCMP1999" /NCGR_SAMPLE_ID=MMETSP1475 /ASSEMBLY_ACC=CAM_ASM_001111 /LENGTH=58 /DNA_ID=CAMNT_0044488371 /DNA_START=310 /DNA_END=486 /DNA_ORIENTATION=+